MTARALCSAVLLVAVATSAHAQRAGAPPFHSPLQSPGVGVALQVTNGNVTPALGRVTAITSALDVRVRTIVLSLGGAWLEPESAGSGWGADAAVAPELRAPLRAISIDGGFHLCDLIPTRLGLRLRAGAAHSRVGDADEAHLTELAAGSAVFFRAPAPPLTLELWTEPRLHVRYANDIASGGPESTTRTGVGWTIGLAITATSGFGGSIAADALWIERPPNRRFRASGIGVGAAVHYLH